jgi:phosphomevalonate kinase
MIILISGKQRSGKNILGSLIAEKIPQFRCVGFADAVKDEYCTLTGINRNAIERLKNTVPKHRTGLVEVAENRKLADLAYWAKKFVGLDNIIVTDFRFLVEVDTFPEAFKIRITRDKNLREAYSVLSNEDHPSETELDTFRGFDWHVSNHGDIYELRKTIEPLIRRLKTLTA